MSDAEITDLHDESAAHGRTETMDTDWTSIASAAFDQWQVWAFALLSFGLATFGFLFHEDWYGEVTFGLLTLAALAFGVRRVRDQLTRYDDESA